MPFWRRRRFLINRPLQLGLLWNSLLHVILFVAVTGCFPVPPCHARAPQYRGLFREDGAGGESDSVFA